MNELIWIFIIATILLMLFLTLQAAIKFILVKKELAEANAKVIYEKKFIKVSYENDFKIVLDIINEACNNTSFIELKEYHDSRNIINDKVFAELTKKITLEVYGGLSKEYIDLMSGYVEDPQLFIYEKVYYRVLSIVMDINKTNIANLN